MAAIKSFIPGFRLINGSHLNALVDALNSFLGATGSAAQALVASTATFSGKFGYAGTGVGASVTQASNRTTGVQIDKLCGEIVTNNASLAAETAAEFTVTNSQVSLHDVVALCQQSGSNGGNTSVWVSTVADGSFKIKVANNNAAAGTAETGAIKLNFLVQKAVAA